MENKKDRSLHDLGYNRGADCIRPANRQGIAASELKYVSFEKFKRKAIDLTVPEDILLQQWKDQENRRKRKMEQVIKCREIIMNAEINRIKSRSSREQGANERANSQHGIDYKDSEKLNRSRRHNASRMSVSYTRNENNDHPLAIEIKLEKINDKRSNKE